MNDELLGIDEWEEQADRTAPESDRLPSVAATEQLPNTPARSPIRYHHCRIIDLLYTFRPLEPLPGILFLRGRGEGETGIGFLKNNRQVSPFTAAGD